MIDIGFNKNGIVKISTEAFNQNMYAVGIPGSGKTTIMLSVAQRYAEEGELVVVINWHQCLNHQFMIPEFREKYEKYAEVIDVARDGIKIPLFEKLPNADGSLENDVNVFQRITSLFKGAANLSAEQDQQLYKCVKEVYHSDKFAEKDITSIEAWLESQDKAVAKIVLSKLRPFTSGKLLRNGNFLESNARIYEFDLNGLEYDMQTVVVKFILDYLLRLANKGFFLENGLTLFLDEALNLECGPGSTLFTLMNESRRLKLRVLLAFPSLFAGKKKNMEIVTQCGTAFYFKVSDRDRRKIAEMIDAKDSDAHVFTLSRLDKGECIVKGVLEVNGRKTVNPIIMKTLL